MATIEWFVKWFFFLAIATAIMPAMLWADDLGKGLEPVSEYVDSVEWDSCFLNKFRQFRKHEKSFLKNLKSHDSKRVFISAVMLGLLEKKEAIPELTLIRITDPYVKIAVSFALAKLDHEREKNIKYLMEQGTISQDVAGAQSIKYLEAVELLSLFREVDFIAYTSRLKTDEVFQLEAISVSKIRNRSLGIGVCIDKE